MKNRRSYKTGPTRVHPRTSGPSIFLTVAVVSLAALIAGAILYRPALYGPFVFDDLALPFRLTVGEEALTAWLAGTRPVLMFSYWLNHELSPDPFSYHALNLVIHAINTGLVFLVVGRLLSLANWAPKKVQIGAICSATLFLVHPLATESVSYIAGRSESLAALFVLAAFAIFLYRREQEIRWRDAVAILVLFGLGVMTKENAVALAGLFVLTDFVFPRASSRRLYLLLAPAAVLAVGLVLRALMHGGNAGFTVREFTWYQYAFTQLRAIFTYARLAVLPFGQSIDHDFPISHNLFEYGACFYAAALAVVIVVAIRERRTYPLACFGVLAFLIWLAPTSSVIPIADPLVERRMYLPLVGLILVGCDLVSRVRLSDRAAWLAVGSAVLVLGFLTWDRNILWGEPEKLFAAAAWQSENNPRPVANLAETLIEDNRCPEALPWVKRAAGLLPHNYVIEASWGRVLECMGRHEEALVHLQTAADTHPTWKLFELIGLLYGEMGRMELAGMALRKAVVLEPNAGSPHRSLALWHQAMHDPASAEMEYRTALSIDGNDSKARIGLAKLQSVAQEQKER